MRIFMNEEEKEDDPRQYNGPTPGRLFAAGLVIAAFVIVALTAGLVLGHEIGRAHV